MRKSLKKTLNMFNLKKRRPRGYIIAVFQYLKACHKEENVDLFSTAPKGKTRSNE